LSLYLIVGVLLVLLRWAEAIVACDFLTVDTVDPFPRGLGLSDEGQHATLPTSGLDPASGAVPAGSTIER
jgi:hypothetical protein